MAFCYYLGQYNRDTRQFNKYIPKKAWEQLKDLTTPDSIRNSLKYYTLKNCFVKDIDSGEIYIEEYPNVTVKQFPKNKWQFIELQYQRTIVPIMLTQYEYFNKQVCKTFVTKYKNNTVHFTEYQEKGTIYYDISCEDLDTIVQLSSSLSSS